MTHMELDVEVGILDPVRTIQSPRDVDQPGPEQRLVPQASLERGDDLLEANKAVRRAGRIVDAQATDVCCGVLGCSRLINAESSTPSCFIGNAPSGFAVLMITRFQ